MYLGRYERYGRNGRNGRRRVVYGDSSSHIWGETMRSYRKWYRAHAWPEVIGRVPVRKSRDFLLFFFPYFFPPYYFPVIFCFVLFFSALFSPYFFFRTIFPFFFLYFFLVVQQCWLGCSLRRLHFFKLFVFPFLSRIFCPVLFFPYHFPVFFQKSRRLKSNVLKYQLVVFIVHVVITQFKFLAEYPFKRHP